MRDATMASVFSLQASVARTAGAACPASHLLWLQSAPVRVGLSVVLSHYSGRFSELPPYHDDDG